MMMNFKKFNYALAILGAVVAANSVDAGDVQGEGESNNADGT